MNINLLITNFNCHIMINNHFKTLWNFANWNLNNERCCFTKDYSTDFQILNALYKLLCDFRMANPMMHDSVWTKQQKYEEAEALYQQVLAGTAPKSAPKGAGGGKGAKVV